MTMCPWRVILSRSFCPVGDRFPLLQRFSGGRPGYPGLGGPGTRLARSTKGAARRARQPPSPGNPRDSRGLDPTGVHLMIRSTTLSSLALAALLSGTAVAQDPTAKPAAQPAAAMAPQAPKDTTKKKMATAKKKSAHKKKGAAKTDTTTKKP